MKAVNLLPPERRGIRRSSPLAPFLGEPMLLGAIGLSVLVVGALGYTAHTASGKISSRNEAIRRLDQQLARLTPATTSSPNQASARLAAVTTLAGGRTTWDGFLGTLSRVVPEDVWLLTLSAQGSAAPVAPTPVTTPTTPSTAIPSAVTFTGYTYSQPSVARMMRRLELVPWLQDVSLVSSTKSVISDHIVYQFTLGANFISLPEVGT